MIGLALRFAIRNLRRHGRRVLIMGLGIAVGVAAAVVHRGLVAGIRSQMIDHLVVAQYGHVAILPPLDAGPEGGGSIRAKREVDKTLMVRLKDKRNLEAKVEMVKLGRFPIVAVKLKVTRPAKEGAGKSIKRNTSIVVIPALKVDDGKISLQDSDTLLNAGAFYLKRGDKVAVRLGEQKGKVWMADYIERK